ncbi:MAG: flagellin [Candidatus Sericytochromatia bacterium]|nr:flagellin [Candidatus Sericytochromatia bacterium]
MRINTNVNAVQAWRNLQKNDDALSKSLERLSTGLRINRGKDDASGLAISERLRSQISGLTAAEQNIQTGFNMVGIADGVLEQMTAVTQRMRDLTVAAANTASGSSSLSALDTEFQALKSQITQMASSTAYQGTTLFTGSATTVTLQVGPEPGSASQMTLSFGPLNGTTGTFDIAASAYSLTASTNFSSLLTSIDGALNFLLNERTKVGAQANALDFKINQIQVTRENLLSADSRIRDTDIAYETALLTRNQILVQSATAMLAQANAKSQNLLRLLQ